MQSNCSLSKIKKLKFKFEKITHAKLIAQHYFFIYLKLAIFQKINMFKEYVTFSTNLISDDEKVIYKKKFLKNKL